MLCVWISMPVNGDVVSSCRKRASVQKSISHPTQVTHTRTHISYDFTPNHRSSSATLSFSFPPDRASANGKPLILSTYIRAQHNTLCVVVHAIRVIVAGENISKNISPQRIHQREVEEECCGGGDRGNGLMPVVIHYVDGVWYNMSAEGFADVLCN